LFDGVEVFSAITLSEARFVGGDQCKCPTDL
jgi:hypothetical protein